MNFFRKWAKIQKNRMMRHNISATVRDHHTLASVQG
jgi:hypothetical protein